MHLAILILASNAWLTYYRDRIDDFHFGEFLKVCQTFSPPAIQYGHDIYIVSRMDYVTIIIFWIFYSSL